MVQRMFSSVTKCKGQDLKWRLIRSLALLLSYVIHGMFLGTVGPTLLDFQIRTNSSIGDVTYIILGRALGMCVGTFLGKKKYTRVALMLSDQCTKKIVYSWTIEIGHRYSTLHIGCDGVSVSDIGKRCLAEEYQRNNWIIFRCWTRIWNRRNMPILVYGISMGIRM